MDSDRINNRLRVYLTPHYWLCTLGCATPFILLSLGAIMIINYDPSFSIKTFYVPALNKSINQTTVTDTDSLIFFNLELDNEMGIKGLRYGPINLTFSYATANTSTAIGIYTIAGFYQGKGKKAQRRDVAVATGSVPWLEAVMSALSVGSTVDFRVDLFTKVRFKNYLSYSSKKRVVAGGIVKVDDSGRKVGEKPVELANRGAKSERLVAAFVIIGLLAAYACLAWFFLCFIWTRKID